MLKCLLQMSYYAVAIGKCPGVYRTWAECEKQVKGFTQAKYKKFKTLSEAEGFVVNLPSSSAGPSKPLKRKNEETGVATAVTVKRAKPEDSIVMLKVFGNYTFPIDGDGYVHVLIANNIN